ncbi:Pentatricopeptide repeat-containing protein, mitochondrial [Zostera marina]|uniref:Pentatricopeptide repeat-containing protein, mitochondrial n=1 Tax=Zostera marina TaxID=29655 RepID=A0A0K9PYN4_ZOSMR|nr:Pentatricopeptide repeat-containing protein, mitochondrial [Zostera marina]
MEMIKATSRIRSLAWCGLINNARQVFDEMPNRDTVAWNAMITSYTQSGNIHQSFLLFHTMRFTAAVNPDHFTFTALLTVSADVANLCNGKMFHALAIASGFTYSSLPVCNSLINLYAKCSSPSAANAVFEEISTPNEISWCSLLFAYAKVGDLHLARRTFDRIPCRTVVSWNTLIWAFCQAGDVMGSVEVFKEMMVSGQRGDADASTFSTIVNGCVESEQFFDVGCAVHGFTVKTFTGVEVSNAILSFYSKFGFPDRSRRIFESMNNRTVTSWNAVIDVCMKAGDVDQAVTLFNAAPEKNVVTWTCVIGGHVRNGNGEDALNMFAEMTRCNHRPDEYTFGSVLQACANLAILPNGKMIHGYVIQIGFTSDVYVGNGLVNMYAKSGDLQSSIEAFNDIPTKDLVSWNAMLFGFTSHGLTSDALELYTQMIKDQRTSPDRLTFIGLLTGCSHSGRINEAQQLVQKMRSTHGMNPEAQHLTCLIDMLGRAGSLDEARMLGSGELHTKALLGACALHDETRLGTRAGQKLIGLEPDDEVGYVMLSNLYCACGRWEEAEKIRKVMLEHGVKKSPGCSWVQIRDVVSLFVSGNICNNSNYFEHMPRLRTMLSTLHLEMTTPCFE